MNIIRRRKFNPVTRSVFYLLTFYLTLFVAVASEPKNPVVTVNSGSALTVQQTATPTATPVIHHATLSAKFQACVWCYIIAFLIFLGILIWVFIKVCKAIKNIGKHHNPPPDNPKNGSNGSSSIRIFDITTNNSLPVMQVPLTTTATNAVGQNLLAELFGVTNGTDLTDSLLFQGVGIGDYDGTNSQVINGNFVDWTGATMVNFSVLGTTNLVNWQGLCTVLEWVNTVPTNSFANPTNVWVCQAVYTNTVTFPGGVATTNGTLANVFWINLLPHFNGVDFVATNATVFGTPQTIIDTTTKPNQFFKLSCNTNATDAELTITP